MHYRRTWLACAAAAFVASTAGLLAAQTFEQTVNGALSKDGALYQQSQALKQSVDQNAAQQAADQQTTDGAAQDDGIDRGGGGHGGGGGHPGGGNPGGGHGNPPGGGHGNPPGGGHGNPPGGGHGNPGRDHGNPGHGHPAPHDPGHHRDIPNRDWGRWHGHPGWGNHYGRWDWRDGYPHWWGWIIWRGERRDECLNYYDGLYGQCNDSCELENSDCVNACQGDSDCAAQCDASSESCYDTCTVDYDNEVATCPAFIGSAKAATIK